MDFDKVISAHTSWKNRFKKYLNGEEQLEPQTVAKDDVCELGRWLYGAGQAFAQHPEFADLKTKHAQFHAQAAQVIRASQKLPKAQALALVNIGTPYAQASAACVTAITKLRQLVLADA